MGDDNNPIQNPFFTKLKLMPSADKSLECVIANYDPSSTPELLLTQTDCSKKYIFVCQAFPPATYNCPDSIPYMYINNSFEMSLDPRLQDFKKIFTKYESDTFKDIIQRLDKVGSHTSLLSSLWYYTLPCFDVQNITTTSVWGNSILKYCEWKGVPISCSAIFTTFPTDNGMCCTFNMRSAEEIFQGKKYQHFVKSMQEYDKANSVINSTIPEYFSEQSEPKTLPGRNKGLTLILDGHSNFFDVASVNSDTEGFLGYIGTRESFPFMSEEAFEIKPGQVNMIALSATNIYADENLRAISVEDRKCRFSDENSDLKLHKFYSYTNCMFECRLLFAQSQLLINNISTIPCLPWYFPSQDDEVVICDPWEAVEFFKFMTTHVPENSCEHCVTECDKTKYDYSVISAPFRQCDTASFGVSHLCNIVDNDLPQPYIFSDQVWIYGLKIVG